MRDIEVHLMDQGGQMMSSKSTLPSVIKFNSQFFALEAWVREQVLTHPEAGVTVPIELQNRSMTVRGWIRVGE